MAVVQDTFTHKQYTEQHNNSNWEQRGPRPVFASYTLAFALQLRKKHGKTSVKITEECQLARWKQNIQNRTEQNIYNNTTSDSDQKLGTFALFWVGTHFLCGFQYYRCTTRICMCVQWASVITCIHGTEFKLGRFPHSFTNNLRKRCTFLRAAVPVK